MHLSAHFTLSEFTKSQTAARLGINNEPPAEVIINLKRLCANVLEPLRNILFRPLVITSGYRCPALNEQVGGNRTGSHPKGEAADFECPGVDNLRLAVLVRDNGFIFDQLILEMYTAGVPSSGWVHVSHKASHNRGEVWTAFAKPGGGARYEKGLPKAQLPQQ